MTLPETEKMLMSDLLEKARQTPGYQRLLAEATKQVFPKKDYSWVCNQCGAHEYTMAVSESDVHQLGCGRCGGDEWHKEPSKDHP